MPWFRSRTGASARISASIRSASPAPSRCGSPAGSWRQGASTITQQLARNIFLNNSRTLTRKMREAVLAMALEWKFSKDQILELYLNKVYFGGGAYGVDSASRKFFGHPGIGIVAVRGGDHRRTGQGAIALFAHGRCQGGGWPRQGGAQCDAGEWHDRRRGGRSSRFRPRSSSRPRAGRIRCAISPTGRCPSSKCCCRTTASRSRSGPRSMPICRTRAAAAIHAQTPERRARRAGQPRPRRGGARDGRRHRLCHLELQPRGQCRAPAGLGLEAVRLSRSARSRDQAQ